MNCSNDKQYSKQQQIEIDVITKFHQTVKGKDRVIDITSLDPPHPDILCKFDSGRRIAYELTETIDPNIVRNLDFSVSVKCEMRTYFENMPRADQERLNDIFSNADLYFTFSDGTGKSKFRKLLPTLFQLLLECSSNTGGDIAHKELPDGVDRIRIVRDEFIGPMFNASGLGLYIADKTVERIEDKFSKRYECEYPIELVVHSKTKGLMKDILWLDDVKEVVIGGLAESQFDRIWIFDYIQSSVRYVYPDS